MEDPLRILLIDDHPEDRVYIIKALEKEYTKVEVEKTRGRRSFIQSVQRGDFDLVITDDWLPWSDGLAVCLQSKTQNPDIPVIMITDANHEESAVQAMKTCVDDYVIRSDSHLSRLPAIVHSLFQRKREKKEAEARYQNFFENIPIGLFRSRPDGRIIDANPVMLEILDYPDKKSFSKLKASELYFNPGDRLNWQNRVKKTGAVQHYETQLKRRDGKAIWVRGNARAVYEREGKIKEYEGSVEDITDFKQVQENLQETADTLRSLIETSPLAIVALDKQKNVLLWNKAAESLFGWAASEVIGLPHPIVPEDRREEFEKLFNRELRGMSVFGQELKRRKKDGSLVEVSLWATPFHNARGEVIGTIAFHADITERKRAEQMLKESKERLRTMAIRMEEIEEAERRRLSRELHDRVGQSLAALGINLGILRSQLPPEGLKKIDDRLKDTQKLAKEMTKAIRAVMSELRPAVLDDYGLLAALHGYADQFSMRTEIAALVKGKERKTRLSSSIETALFRIAQEAVTNVAKHAQAGRVIITLSEKGENAHLTVEDNGKGFEIFKVPSPGENGGWGILTMRERAEAAGGEFESGIHTRQGDKDYGGRALEVKQFGVRSWEFGVTTAPKCEALHPRFVNPDFSIVWDLVYKIGKMRIKPEF